MKYRILHKKGWYYPQVKYGWWPFLRNIGLELGQIGRAHV